MTSFTLAGGCFWCLDAVFRRLKGIKTSTCGYVGGSKMTAHYYTVASGLTKHAEAVQITFDESIISQKTILEIFFLIHNPTTLNQQGADIGPQYRSAMFYKNDEDKKIFEQALLDAQNLWGKPIVTTLEPRGIFYEAEVEHQGYFSKNPGNGYCSLIIEPKITQARKRYTSYFLQDV